MTNGVYSSTVGSTYANTISKNASSKDGVKEANQKGIKQQDKLQQIKEQIESGNYKIDIDKLAKKMAEELIS
jgi:anti-sigma28 factor (negative regulator of flagellin synthesis)